MADYLAPMPSRRLYGKSCTGNCRWSSRASWASWPKPIDDGYIPTLRPCWPILAWQMCAGRPGALAGACCRSETTYRPPIRREPRTVALIVPAVEYGKLHDLVAMDLADRHTATRLGVAAVVGFDEIERARVHGRPLFVFNDPLMWLRGGALGAAVVDWARAVEIFDGVPLLLCAASMVDRLEQATANCWQPPSIAAIEGCRHAA